MSRTREFRRCFSVSAAIAAMAGAAVVVPPGAHAQIPLGQPAGQGATSQDTTRKHVVRRGDTLWDLAATYYGNPFLWRVIYDANKPVVENPHWIFPIERLVIPGRETASSEPLGRPVPGRVIVDVIAVEPVDTPATVLESVDMRRPLVTAGEHAMAPWLVGSPAAGVIGRIVRVADPTVTEDMIPQQLYPNTRVVIGDLRGTPMQPGDSVQIVRIGRRLGLHGQVVEPLGVMRIDSLGTSVVSAHVSRQFATARVGDYVMALPARPALVRGDLAPIAGGAEGVLLEFLQDAEIHGPGDFAFVTLGPDHVRIGDELAVYIPREKLDNERPEILPAQMVGVVRVVKVSDHSATVRVTGVRNTGFRNGLPARLVRRAP